MHANLCSKQNEIDDEILLNCCKTSMSSKIIGGDTDFFSKLCVDAMKRIGTTNDRGKMKYPVAAINIMKVHGASTRESYLVNG